MNENLTETQHGAPENRLASVRQGGERGSPGMINRAHFLGVPLFSRRAMVSARRSL
jgi:hypothetical protein